jgi:hypothetical protein
MYNDVRTAESLLYGGTKVDYVRATFHVAMDCYRTLATDFSHNAGGFTRVEYVRYDHVGTGQSEALAKSVSEAT